VLKRLSLCDKRMFAELVTNLSTKVNNQGSRVRFHIHPVRAQPLPIYVQHTHNRQNTRRVGNKLINKSESPRPRLVLDTTPHPIMLYRSYCTSTRDAAGYFAGCACVARIWAATARVLGECGFEPVTLGYSLLLISLLPTRRTSSCQW